MAILAVVADTVTYARKHSHMSDPEALMAGYRVSFWVCFALMFLVAVMALIGLRRLDKFAGR